MGPAGKAGIEKKDIIIEMKEKRITDTTAFFELYQQLVAGEKVKFKVIRNGKEKKINVRLGATGMDLKEVKKIYKLAKSSLPAEMISPDTGILGSRTLQHVSSPVTTTTTTTTGTSTGDNLLLGSKTLQNFSPSVTTTTTATTGTSTGDNLLNWTNLGEALPNKEKKKNSTT